MAAMESDGGQLQLASSKKKPMPLDALLIGSFPAPPTHIPLTPTSPNPPLSLPPSTPLPPVPGPSRISGHESLLLLSASRSRRSSRMSTASDHSRPPSTSSPPQSPSNTRPPAIAFSISEEPVDFLKDAGGIGDDDDDDEDALLNIAVPRQMPTPRKHQANESISDIDVRDILAAVVPDEPTDTEDILVGLPPKPTPRTPLPARKFKHTLSLADPIDPHTIPPMAAAVGGGGTIARSFTFPSSASPRRTVFHDDKAEDKIPPRSPPSPDIGTIISKTPRPILRSRVSSTASASSTMGKKTSSKELRRRASEGLARTQSNNATRRRDPRVSDPTMMVRSTSDLPYVTPYRSYGDSPYGIYGDGQLRGGDEDGDGPESDDDDTRSWIDHDEYGKPLVAPPRKRKTEEWGVGVGVEEARLERLERQLEGSESDGSDSSLDLHTPLPHLMLRHGLLSPRSKLIAVPPAGGRDSVASLASTTTMNTTTTTKGPLKDARDTEQRRARHKDGRLLRGGIGLTTGLGWSDSEDEDAPSALTRRISALTLSRRSSLASTASRSTSHISLSLSRKGSSASAASSASRVHPLARSYSSGQLGEGYDNDNDDDRDRDGEVDEWGARSSRGSEDMMLSQSLSLSRATRVKTRARARTPTRWSSHSLPTASNGRMKNGGIGGPGAGAGVVGPGPPTAWTPGKATRIRRSGSGSTRTSVASSGSSVGGHGNGGGGVGGMMIPEGEEVEAVGQHGQGGMSMTPSPSTASTLSIPLPVTPQDCEAGLEEGHAAGGGGGGAQLKREKSLPPLPPALRRSPGSTNLGGLSAMQAMSKSTGPGGFAFPGAQQGSNNRPRTTSVSSAGSALRVRTNIGGSQEAPVRATVTAVGMNMKSTPAPTMMSTPRPLRLAQAPLLGPASTSTLPSPRMLPPPSSPLPRSQQGDRPAVPVPGVGYNNHNTLRSRSPLPPPGGSLPSTPSTPTTPVVPLGERPKPRTGTGMVYRSSAGSAPSRMRLPSSVVRPPPASAAVTTTTTVRPAVGVGIAL